MILFRILSSVVRNPGLLSLQPGVPSLCYLNNRFLWGCRLFFLTGLFLILACSRPETEMVATVNGEKISTAEYRFRRNFSPYIFHEKATAAQNREFAESLIGEKLMAQEARTLGLAEQPRYKAQMAQLRKEFLFEALYKERIAGQANQDQAMVQLLRTVMAKQTMHISNAAFNALEQALATVLGQKPFIRDSTRTLSEREAGIFRKTFGDLQRQSLVRFAGGDEWTVADFLLRLSVGPYPLPAPSSSNFRTALKQIIRKAAELEYLSRSAEEQGLGQSTQVQQQVQMWSDALLTLSLMQQMNEQTQVDSTEIQHHYTAHRFDYAVQGIPMPLDSVRQEIARLLRSQKTGELYRNKLKSMQKNIWINRAVLDTLHVLHSADVVIKRHFPGRMLAPVVFPFAELIGQPLDSVKPTGINK
jgi:hypothetical protein